MPLFATVLGLVFSFSFFQNSALALDFDWHGEFSTETNTLFGYSNSGLLTDATDHGYAIPNNGNKTAAFQNLFLKLEPRAIVNDNVTLHSVIWFGTPSQSVFGSNQPSQTYFYQTNTGTAALTASELYAEIATDFGTVSVGRVPLNWGLGVVWSNNPDNPFERFPSTGDAIRLTTKFGAFKFIPGVVKYRLGSNYGGAANTVSGVSTTLAGDSGVSDYTLGLTYENPDEQIDLGLLFLRRVTGPNASVANPLQVDALTSTSYAYNLWDFYLKKKAGFFTLTAEIPFTSGTVGGVNYSTVSGAAKVIADLSDHWALNANFGMASGQDNIASGTTASKLTAFYFHPDYKPGFILFNYNLKNLSSGTSSPYDSPITDARFLALGFNYAPGGRWTQGFQGIYAMADKTADGVAGNAYFNNNDRHYHTEAAGNAQGKNLGFELDYMLGYQWDESLRLGLDLGIYLPGNYYAFSDSTSNNSTSAVFGSNLNLSVKF